MRRRLCLAFVLACTAVGPPLAFATTMRRMDTAELVSRAAVVVHGEVVSTEVVYDEGPNGPANVQTITTIAVTQSLKGSAGTTVKVAGFGGQVGEYIYRWPGVPEFEVGEETIVMLSKPAADNGNKKSLFAPLGRDDHMMVTGLEQGRFKISADAQGQKIVKQEFGDVKFTDETGVAAEKQPRRIGEFITEIRGIVIAQEAQAQSTNQTEGGK